jgi:hypothetical protein
VIEAQAVGFADALRAPATLCTRPRAVKAHQLN